MNRAKELRLIVEAALKADKVKYKAKYNGPISSYHHTSSHFKVFNTDQVRNAEGASVLHAHDTLGAEAKQQFEKENQSIADQIGAHPDHTGLQKAIERYTGSAYKEINKHLRSGEHLTSTNKIHLANLKKLTKYKTQHSFTLYRGVGTKLVDPKQGEILHDRGFTSASLLPSMVAEHFTDKAYDDHSSEAHKQLFKIHVPKGTKGHYVSGHQFSHSEGGEREFVFHPGTQFKVKKVAKHPNGHTYIHLAVHSQEADTHPDDEKYLHKFSIDGDSPDEDHKFILNHYKNHEYYTETGLEKEHAKLMDMTPGQKGRIASQIKKDNPSKYAPFDIDKQSPNADHKFVLNHYKNHLGYDDESLVSKHKDLLNYPGDAAYDKKNIIKGNPNIYKTEHSVNIEKDSPDEDHKFILNHMKHHLNMDDNVIHSLHKSMLDNTPEQKKATADTIKSQNPALYSSKPHANTGDTLKLKTVRHSTEDKYGIEGYHKLDADHKSILDNANFHEYPHDSIKDLHHIITKTKSKPHLPHYRNLLSAAKAGEDPYAHY